MKASELINNLRKIVKIHGDLELVYTVDEGNKFNKLNYTPSIGSYEDNDFVNDIETYKEKVICIN